MQRAIVKDFFREQAAYLMEGQIDLLLRSYTLPLPVYLATPPELIVVANRNAMANTLRNMATLLRQAGIRRLHTQTMQVQFRHGRSCKARVMWFPSGGASPQIGYSIATYYLSPGEHGLKIDMIQVEEAPPRPDPAEIIRSRRD